VVVNRIDRSTDLAGRKIGVLLAAILALLVQGCLAQTDLEMTTNHELGVSNAGSLIASQP
jgi:hypothetical protein